MEEPLVPGQPGIYNKTLPQSVWGEACKFWFEQVSQW